MVIWKKKKINKTSTVHQRFQSVYKAILFYCLKCRKNIESKNPKVIKAKRKEKQRFYQNVQCLIVKNQDFLKTKKLVGY